MTGDWNEELGIKDSTWLTPAGEEMTPEHWQDPAARCFGLLLDGRAQTSGIRAARQRSHAAAHHQCPSRRVVNSRCPKCQVAATGSASSIPTCRDEDEDYDRNAAFKFGIVIK